MNSRERVLTSLAFQEPDRVPLFEAWIEYSIREAFGNVNHYQIREKLELDCMPISSAYPSENAWQNGVDEWGRIFKRGQYEDGRVKTFDDLRKYYPSVEYAKKWFPSKEIKWAQKKYGESHGMYYAFHDAGMTLAYMSMGMKDFFLAIRRNRELVEAVMEKSAQWTISMIEQANATNNIDFIVMGDDVAYNSGSMLSPKVFRELVLPYYKEFVKASDVPLIWHSDGDIRDVLPMVCEAGFAGLHSLDPDAGIDLGQIKQEYGEKLILIGNLNCSEALVQSDFDIIHRDVERCMNQGAKGGGYIFSSCNSLFRPMSEESIVEAFRYAKEIGRYSHTP